MDTWEQWKFQVLGGAVGAEAGCGTGEAEIAK